MTAADRYSSHHPAPKRNALRSQKSFFALFGGPLAWFVQLNVSFALASQPCFLHGERIATLAAAADWTRPLMIALTMIAGVIALLSALISWRAYQRIEDEGDGDPRRGIEVGTERRRFLALWGIALGAGFALATAFTAIAFFVPRCAG
jgi:hypothetical protein